ncbi:MAG: hypothetical protein ABIH23_28790 [bacterium]
MNDAVPTQGSNRIQMGMLQTIQLAQSFAEQVEELRALDEKNKALETELETFREQAERQREIVELGERQMERLRRETENRLRAMTLHTRDDDRLATLRNRLEQSDLSPGDLVRWHEAIAEEFYLLYPTRPLSEPLSRSRMPTVRTESLDQFRFRSNPEQSHKAIGMNKENTHDSTSR